MCEECERRKQNVTHEFILRLNMEFFEPDLKLLADAEETIEHCYDLYKGERDHESPIQHTVTLIDTKSLEILGRLAEAGREFLTLIDAAKMHNRLRPIGTLINKPDADETPGESPSS